MYSFYKKTTLLFLFFFFTTISFGQQKTLSKDAFISILTCDPGNDELYSLFGHTAIRINDPANQIDVVYNYGAFDFSTPNFYLKFVKGDLQYFVTTSTFDEFCAEYRYFQRGVYEQKLNLSPTQKQHLFEELYQVLNSESRFYTYKFIDRNCTTMVVDMVQNHLKNPLNLKIKDAVKTNRTILYGYLKDHFYENLGINILFGLKTDKLFDKIFLPLQFMESIAISKNGALPLTDVTSIVNIKNEQQAPFSLWNNYYSYLLFLIIVVLFNKKWLTLSYFTLMGILGLFLLGVSAVTSHDELVMNYNILLFNPLLLLFVFLILKNKSETALKVAYLNVLLLLIYSGMLLNKVHFLMFLPMIFSSGILLGRLIVGFRRSGE